jgi:myosin heavy subunit
MLACVSRCGGVIEAVRMCRESFPSRYSHQDFYGTFNCLCPGAQGGDMKQAVASMLQQLRVEPAKFRLGKTMVLLKREVVDTMEGMRAKLLGGRAMVLQNTVRRFIAKQELAQKRDIRRKYSGCVKLQSICRRTITRAKYVRMVQAVRLQERKRREEEERKRQEEAAQRNATTAQKAAIAQQQQEEQVRIQKASQAQILQTLLPRVVLYTKCTRALTFGSSWRRRRKPLAPLSCRALPTAIRRMTMPKMRL